MSAQQFGRYIIKSEIGRGGMATVFHAYDPRFERM
jgi:serine/threonine protein kinase